MTMNEFLINDTPVKIWAKVLDPIAYRQIYNLAALPFVFHHLAFMPDVHAGVGMPIGECSPRGELWFRTPWELTSAAECVL